MLADDFALRVDEHQGGPSPAGVLLPDPKFGVVDHQVLQLVPLYGLVQALLFLFVGELGRVNADNHQLVGVFFLYFPQLRKNMHTVNSTVGPEVQQYYLAPQLPQGQRTVGVDPLQPGWELRGVDFAREGATCHDLPLYTSTIPD